MICKSETKCKHARDKSYCLNCKRLERQDKFEQISEDPSEYIKDKLEERYATSKN